MKSTIEKHASALYWYSIIKTVRLLTWLGFVGAAEWVARETGLRALLIELLYGPGR